MKDTEAATRGLLVGITVGLVIGLLIVSFISITLYQYIVFTDIVGWILVLMFSPAWRFNKGEIK